MATATHVVSFIGTVRLPPVPAGNYIPLKHFLDTVEDKVEGLSVVHSATDPCLYRYQIETRPTKTFSPPSIRPSKAMPSSAASVASHSSKRPANDGTVVLPFGSPEDSIWTDAYTGGRGSFQKVVSAALDRHPSPWGFGNAVLLTRIRTTGGQPNQVVQNVPDWMMSSLLTARAQYGATSNCLRSGGALSSFVAMYCRPSDCDVTFATLEPAAEIVDPAHVFSCLRTLARHSVSVAAGTASILGSLQKSEHSPIEYSPGEAPAVNQIRFLTFLAENYNAS